MTGWLKRLTERGEEQDYCPECEAEVDDTVTTCAACGYDIVQQSRFDGGRPPGTPLA